MANPNIESHYSFVSPAKELADIGPKVKLNHLQIFIDTTKEGSTLVHDKAKELAEQLEAAKDPIAGSYNDYFSKVIGKSTTNVYRNILEGATLNTNHDRIEIIGTGSGKIVDAGYISHNSSTFSTTRAPIVINSSQDSIRTVENTDLLIADIQWKQLGSSRVHINYDSILSVDNSSTISIVNNERKTVGNNLVEVIKGQTVRRYEGSSGNKEVEGEISCRDTYVKTYEILAKDKYNVEVQQDANLIINRDYKIEVDNDINAHIFHDLNVSVDNDVNIDSIQDCNITSNDTQVIGFSTAYFGTGSVGIRIIGGTIYLG